MPTARSRQRMAAIAGACAALAIGCSASTTGQSAGVQGEQSSAAPSTAALIAYARYPDATRTSSVIRIGRLDGSGQRQLTGGGSNVIDADPSWSPDVKQVAFDRTVPRSGCGAHCVAREIYTVNVADRTVKQLTYSPASAACGPGGGSVSCHFEPSWSPDGRHLAYTGSPAEGTAQSSIWVADADGRHPHELTHPHAPAADTGPTWSPDSASLAFTRGTASSSSIFRVDIGGGSLKQLTPASGHFGDRPAWSPNGRTILFRSDFNEAETRFRPSRLYTVNADGTGLAPVTAALPNLEYLAASWSADGTQIIAGRVQSDRDEGRAQLVLLNADGSRPRVVLIDPQWQAEPRWAPSP